MTLRKAFAVACVIVVLGAQARTLFPPGYPAQNRYWPFLNYPMYSDAHRLGDSIVRHELRAMPCGASAATLTLPFDSLRMEPWVFWNMLDRLAVSSSPRPLLDTLARLTRSTIHQDPCAFELWRQSLIVGRRGVKLEQTPWVKYRVWPLGADSSAHVALRIREQQ